MRLLLRISNILLRPGREWQAIRDERTTYGGLIKGYCALIAAVPPLAAVMERFIFNRGIVSNAVHSPFGYVIAANTLWYFVIIVNLMITAAVITAIVTPKGPDRSIRGLQLGGYSYTPLFLIGLLIIIPSLNWLLYPAILYSLYLLYLGIMALTGAGRGKAAWQAIASFAATGVIVGTLNMLEYMFESFIASKVFF